MEKEFLAETQSEQRAQRKDLYWFASPCFFGSSHDFSLRPLRSLRLCVPSSTYLWQSRQARARSVSRWQLIHLSIFIPSHGSMPIRAMDEPQMSRL